MGENDKRIFTVVKDKNNPFVMLNKGFINDNRLSWKATGLLAYLLSKPDDWKVYQTELAKRKSDGLNAIQSALDELKLYGYIHIHPVKKENGKIEKWETLVFESPEINPYYSEEVYKKELERIEKKKRKKKKSSPDMESPDMENPNVENPQSGFSDTTNKLLLLNNDKKNNRYISKSEANASHTQNNMDDSNNMKVKTKNESMKSTQHKKKDEGITNKRITKKSKDATKSSKNVRSISNIRDLFKQHKQE
jgi:hypothetical protein